MSTQLERWRRGRSDQSQHVVGSFAVAQSASRPLLILFVAGVALAGWLVRAWFHQFDRIDWDGYFYLTYARNIAAGQVFLISPAWTPYPPGYPALIALLSALGISFEAAAVVVSQVAGVLLLVVLCSFLARSSWRSALVLGVLLIFSDALVLYSNAVLSEALFTLLFYVLLLYWLAGMGKRRAELLTAPAALWSGALIGLLIGVRSIGLVFLGPYLLIFGLGGLLARRRRVALLTLGLALALALGYTLYTRQVDAAVRGAYGVAVPGYAQQEIGRGLSEAGYGVVDRGGGLARFLWDNQASLGRMWLQKTIANLTLGFMWNTGTSTKPLLPAWSLVFLGLGLFAARHRLLADPARLLAVLALVAAYYAAIPLFTADTRYYVPLLPGALALAAIGLADAAERAENYLPARARRLPWRAVALLAFTGFVAVSSYRYLPHDRAAADNPWVEAGGWARAALHPARVLVDHPAPAYFMGAEPAWLKSPVAAEARRYALENGLTEAAIRCSNGDGASELQDAWDKAGWALVHRTSGLTYDACVFTLR